MRKDPLSFSILMTAGIFLALLSVGVGSYYLGRHSALPVQNASTNRGITPQQLSACNDNVQALEQEITRCIGNEPEVLHTETVAYSVKNLGIGSPYFEGKSFTRTHSVYKRVDVMENELATEVNGIPITVQLSQYQQDPSRPEAKYGGIFQFIQEFSMMGFFGPPELSPDLTPIYESAIGSAYTEYKMRPGETVDILLVKKVQLNATKKSYDPNVINLTFTTPIAQDDTHDDEAEIRTIRKSPHFAQVDAAVNMLIDSITLGDQLTWSTVPQKK